MVWGFHIQIKPIRYKKALKNLHKCHFKNYDVNTTKQEVKSETGAKKKNSSTRLELLTLSEMLSLKGSMLQNIVYVKKWH